MSLEELKSLVEQYRPLAGSGLSASEFHRRIRDDGVSPLSAMVLLRDLYGLNLMECKTIHGNYDEDAATHRTTKPATKS